MRALAHRTVLAVAWCLFLVACQPLEAALGIDAAAKGVPTLQQTTILAPASIDIIGGANTPDGSAAPIASPKMPEICLNVISYENGEIAPKVNVNNYRSLRNNCIESYIAAIDYKYYEYEHQLSRLVRGFNTFASATQTLLSAGAAGVGGSAAQILSGIGASIGTIRNGVDAEVLQNSTINAIVLQMAADRGETLKSILKQMQLDGPAPPLAGAPDKLAPKDIQKQPRSQIVQSTSDVTTQVAATANVPGYTERVVRTRTVTPKSDQGNTGPSETYSMYQASVDLLGYFEAGTFSHALASMQKGASAKAAACKQQVDSLKAGTSAGGGGSAQSSLEPNGC